MSCASCFRRFLYLSIAALAFSAACLASDPGCAWSYSGATGPSNWGTMTGGNPPTTCFKACAETSQSPINIVGATQPNPPLGQISFYYTSALAYVLNNGHTIQVTYTSPGSANTMTYNGKTYNLVQFHFHHQSEHQINGTAYSMELHLVHLAADGTFAVVAVMINKSGSQTNPVFNQVLQHVSWGIGIPSAPIQMAVAGTPGVPGLLPPAANWNPATLQYYSYSGSLTAPPCTEGITWLVLTEPLNLSETQIDQWKTEFGLGDPNNAFNARPLQNLNGRPVYVSPNFAGQSPR